MKLCVLNIHTFIHAYIRWRCETFSLLWTIVKKKKKTKTNTLVSTSPWLLTTTFLLPQVGMFFRVISASWNPYPFKDYLKCHFHATKCRPRLSLNQMFFPPFNFSNIWYFSPNIFVIILCSLLCSSLAPLLELNPKGFILECI